jgi:CarD family transcriptional regulator
VHRTDAARDDLPTVEGTIADAASLTPGQRVVYPGQGVCAVVGIEAKEIAGQRLEMVRLARADDGATLLVPMGKVASVGLRRLPSASQVEGVFHYLGASYDAPELDWKTRHRENAERLLLGGLLGVAEVVKGLHGLSRLRPLPTKEREIYDNARHLLVAEIGAALGVPPGVAEEYLDYALIPPAGVKFALKPPPPPVVLPPKPRPKRPAIVDDLADDLDLPEIEGLGEGDEDAGGEGAEAGEGEARSAPASAPSAAAARALLDAIGRVPAKAHAEPEAKKGAKPAARARPAAKETAKKAPAKKPAAKKAPAKKPAPARRKR